jgi:hypothetical protein
VYDQGHARVLLGGLAVHRQDAGVGIGTAKGAQEQRQMLPDSASAICSSVGLLLTSSSA